MKRWTSGVAVATVLGLSLAACSSSGDTSSNTSSVTVRRNEAAAKLVPEKIAKRGTLVVALDATYPPMEFVDADGKTIIGVDADLVAAIGEALGLKVDLNNAVFDTIIPGIVSGKFDIGASSFTDTKEREQQVDFVTYFEAGQAFYVGQDSTLVLSGIDALCGHTVSLQKGTIQETDSLAQDQACKAAGKPGVTVLSFPDQTAANVAISSGRGEIGFLDSQVAAYVVAQSNGQFKLSGKPFATAPYGFALSKGGLAPAVQAALTSLIADGTYAKILAKWGVSDGAITEPVVNGAIE